MTAATTLAEWAHARRRQWTDEPLPKRRGRERRAVPEAARVSEVPRVPEVPWVPEVPEVSWVPEVAEVPGVHGVSEVAWAPDVSEVLDVPQGQGIREVWEASGVLGLQEPPAPESAPVFQSTEILSLAADITLPPAPAGDGADVGVEVATARRTTWTDIVSRVKWSSLVPRVDWSAVVSRFRSERTSGRPADLRSASGAAVLKAGALIASALEHVRPLGEPSLRWLMRGAALVSTTSVLILLMVHRADLFSGFDRTTLVSRFQQIDLPHIDVSSRLDKVKKTVRAAADASRPAPPPVVPLPRGMGQVTIASPNDDPIVFIDGKPRGKAPATLILPAGSHRLMLRSAKGSVERTIHVDAGESSEIDESIFPGWVAVSAAVDLTLSENGRTLKRDERGWAILSPGPHDIHLDNDQLGIHETRKVVVTPGDTTRLSLAPQTSTLSIAANEPAEVWIDGTSVGEAPIAEAQLTLGMHDVRVRSAAHERWLRVRVTLHPVQLNVDMTAE